MASRVIQSFNVQRQAGFHDLGTFTIARHHDAPSIGARSPSGRFAMRLEW
ncbi:MAG: hypothetical protein R3C49_28040 [Planctomycetaceae bacterium]